MARSSGAESAGGRISMVGSSITSAPSALRRDGERVGLLAGAGDDDALAEERQALVPVELLAQAHHFADDDGGRRLHARASMPGSVARVPVMVCWSGRVAQRTAIAGVSGDAAAGDQFARDLGKRGQPHEDHQRLGVADLGPVDCLRRRGR